MGLCVEVSAIGSKVTVLRGSVRSSLQLVMLKMRKCLLLDQNFPTHLRSTRNTHTQGEGLARFEKQGGKEGSVTMADKSLEKTIVCAF
jgi:hypothetical protein